MNILFEVPSDSIIRLMDNLLERLEIDNAHVIMAPGVDQNKLTSCRSFGKIKNVFQYLDVFYDEYEKYSCFINAYPVDDEILRKAALETRIILVGNKCDLSNERKVTEEEGKKLTDEFGMLFFETSAKTGYNVNFAIETLIEDIIKHYKNFGGKKITLKKDNKKNINNDKKNRCPK